MACTAFAILYVTDGIDTVWLHGGTNSICVDDWLPSAPAAKGGGAWGDSPLSDGRTLQQWFWTNVIDTFILNIADTDQDETIAEANKLYDLLIQALAYWLAPLQNRPVWIVARSPQETETRYAIIKAWSTPGAPSSPYHNPFFNPQDNSVLPSVTIEIEHEIWANTKPGGGCEPSRTETISGPAYLTFDGSGDYVDFGSDAALDDLPDNAVAGKGIFYTDGWVRLRGYGENGEGRILVKGSAAYNTSGVHIFATAADGLCVYINCATTDAYSTSGTDEFSADGKWHYFLVCYDETGGSTPAARTAYIAIDGVWVTSYPIQQASVGNYASDAADNLLAGNNQTPDRCLDGDLGWTRVRNSIPYTVGTDFTPPLRCTLPIIDANTLGFWIYEGSGNITSNLQGDTDRDGTIVGATWGVDCTRSITVDCDCIQTSGKQSAWPYDAWSVNTALPVGGTIGGGIETSTGWLLSADSGAPVAIWRSNDGINWAAAAAPPPTQPYSFYEHSDGFVYAGCAGAGIYRSGDDGNNWALRNAGITVAIDYGITGSGNRLFATDVLIAAKGIYRSDDGGTTWTLCKSGYFFATGNDSRGNVYVSSGSIAGDAAILRSSDLGDNWEIVYQPNDAAEMRFITELSDGYIYTAHSIVIGGLPLGKYRLLRSLSGDSGTWEILGEYSNSTGNANDIILADDEKYYLCELSSFDGIVRQSPDGYDWKAVADLSLNNLRRLVCFSGNSRIYAFGDQQTYWNGEEVDVGRDATCTDEVFIKNAHHQAQLTDIWTYDAAPGATWTSRFPSPSFPFSLFTTAPAAGDMIYWGIDTTTYNSGPFSNLITDILQPFSFLASGYTYVFEYYSSVGPAWTTLDVTDNTNGFGIAGVNAISWAPPKDWIAANLFTLFGGTAPNVTALWVRFRITVLPAYDQAPLQQNRDIYTANWASIKVGSSEIQGILPALTQLRYHNHSDEDGYETIDPPPGGLDLLANRGIIALRSVGDGDIFTCAINLADRQNPIGITVSAGTGSAFANQVDAPTGRKIVHTTTGNGLENWDDAAIILLGPSIAQKYYGVFHIYLRAHLEEPSSSPAGDHDDVRVRLQVRGGSGGIAQTTAWRTFPGRDANGESYRDWYLMDFGRINIPPSGNLTPDELPDQLSIVIQIASETSTNLEVTLYDAWLMPADEWIADFVDQNLTIDSGISRNRALDIDAIRNPASTKRASVRLANVSDYFIAGYQYKGPQPSIAQVNREQRYWSLFARAAYMGKITAGGGATTLTDSYADFFDAGIEVSIIAHNITTGNSAKITAVSETALTTESIAGNWNLNDEYLVVCRTWRSEPEYVHSAQAWKRQRYLLFRGKR